MPNQNKIKHIIPVASGKGGVGKSTVATGLALTLAAQGRKVGLLDADIYGPSIPTLLGLKERPTVENGVIQPVVTHGISAMSIGYLVDTKATLAWRGPMIGKALQQLFNDTAWGALDDLIVDLPPGTGDIQLTLCQKMPITGAIIVTTPQDIALADVYRACEMFQKLNVPLIGVIENMSRYHCTHCGHEEALFDGHGGTVLSSQYDIPMLGELPFHRQIQAIQNYHLYFADIAGKVQAWLQNRPKNYAALFPKIVVEPKKE